MADAPEKDRGETPREAAEREESELGEAGTARSAPGRSGEPLEVDDPREEDGWSQPESSAQKGAPPDEG
jgi:hypothetical protein